MTDNYEISEEQISIRTDIPFKTLQDMEINHGLDEHAVIKLHVTIDSNGSDEVLSKEWVGTKIQAWKQGKNGAPLFCGRLTKISCRRENRFLSAELEGISETAALDKEKRKRSFQDVGMTYRQVVWEVLKDCPKAECVWGVGEDEVITEPLVQYEETDWEFIKRLASHFHSGLIPDIRTGTPAFIFGMKSGTEQNIDTEEIINYGFDKVYYRNGCYEGGMPRTQTFYMEIRTRDNWRIGDFGYYERNRYYVYKKKVMFRQGELIFTYRLGAPGIYYRKKRFNPALAGLRLEGVIKKTEKEKVYMQLDIDKEPQAEYPWAWTPETDNLCYCMPETETKAVLYFPTEEEKDGTAILAVVHNSQAMYTDTQRKEFVTGNDKKLKLYPDRITLEGKDSAALFSLEDISGIHIKSDNNISFMADGNVFMEGKSISVTAPVEVTCRTAESNIGLCRDINLYAPGGVKTVGTGEEKKKAAVLEDGQVAARQETDHWQAAYSGMAAIPGLDFEETAGQETVINLTAFGAIPKVGGGAATIAMAQVMAGKKPGMTSFPTVFRSMDNYTVKGGYLLPEETGKK